tara:strand:- start:3131 stop:3919 length:789 start_codon:yes stop_codon:yes gene_type:complete
MPIDSKIMMDISRELWAARVDGNPATNPSQTHPDITISDAYSIQMQLINEASNNGEIVVGGKIGLSSKANQEKFGIAEPIYGHLFNSMIRPEDEPIEISKMFRPVVEPEICFLLNSELKGPGVNVGTVLSATKGVMPAFEIADSRLKNQSSRVEDNILDNSGAAIVLLGGILSPIENIDLRLVGMILEQNGLVIDTGAGAAVLGHPAQAVAGLANKLSEFDMSLKAGSIIISGTPVAAVPASSGDHFTASFDRIGTVSVNFI